MVLNIFPRREKTAVAPATEPEATLPEPSPEALEEPKKRPTRRGSRGGRGRGKAEGLDGATGTDEETESDEAAEPIAAAPARRTRARTTTAAPAVEVVEDPLSASVVVEETAPPATRPARGRRAPRAEAEAPATPAADENPAPEPARRARGGRGGAASAPEGDASTAGILRAIEQQNRQIEQIIRMQEDLARRGGAAGGSTGTPARVGVFVDAANVELASDRLRARFDWKKILDMLTNGRQLVRAITYSPVHDDPGVSIETQRFVEPFLGKGYKVVTKPLKRFADGTIKANVDIEMALDVIEMLDRLDVVCLVSGDGDFQRLVEVVQAKGVRVEVVAVGSSTASNLRHAADQYIDLQGRLKDVRV